MKLFQSDRNPMIARSRSSTSEYSYLIRLNIQTQFFNDNLKNRPTKEESKTEHHTIETSLAATTIDKSKKSSNNHPLVSHLFSLGV